MSNWAVNGHWRVLHRSRNVWRIAWVEAHTRSRRGRGMTDPFGRG